MIEVFEVEVGVNFLIGIVCIGVFGIVVVIGLVGVFDCEDWDC